MKKIEDYLAIDENSISGIKWINKSSLMRIKIGQDALTTIDKDGYFRGGFDGRELRAHRVIFYLYYGRWPNGPIDHRNGIRSDNRVANLRECTVSENTQNQHKARGYSWHSTHKKWIAHIQIPFGKLKHLGYFNSELAARQAYLSAKSALHPGWDKEAYGDSNEE